MEPGPTPGAGSDLPEAAVERLRSGAAAGGSWTSDLSVAELSAVRRVGFRPARDGGRDERLPDRGARDRARLLRPAGGRLGLARALRAWGPGGRRRGSAVTSRATPALTRSTASAMATGSITRTSTTSRRSPTPSGSRSTGSGPKPPPSGRTGSSGCATPCPICRSRHRLPVVELKMIGTAISRPNAAALKRAVHLSPVGPGVCKAPRHGSGACGPRLRSRGGQVLRADASGCRVRPHGPVPSSSSAVRPSNRPSESRSTNRGPGAGLRRPGSGSRRLAVDQGRRRGRDGLDACDRHRGETVPGSRGRACPHGSSPPERHAVSYRAVPTTTTPTSPSTRSGAGPGTRTGNRTGATSRLTCRWTRRSSCTRRATNRGDL